MRFRFTTSDETAPWYGAEVKVCSPLDLPMQDLAEPLEELGWRIRDVLRLRQRAADAYTRDLAEEQGEPYAGPPVEFSARDEAILTRLGLFASLRLGGVAVSWRDTAKLSVNDYEAVPLSPDQDWVVGDVAGEASSEASGEDPQRASTDSVQAVDAVTTTPAD